MKTAEQWASYKSQNKDLIPLYVIIQMAMDEARAEGFKAGQEAMRERCAKEIEPLMGKTEMVAFLKREAERIRALPVNEEPKE